jgi:hypothetical protein
MPKKKKQFIPDFWERGQVAQLARLVNVSDQYMYDLLARRRAASPQMGALLEQASRVVLGFPIPWSDWVLAKSTDHPAFRPLVPGLTPRPSPIPVRGREKRDCVYLRDIIHKIPLKLRMRLMHGADVDRQGSGRRRKEGQ